MAPAREPGEPPAIRTQCGRVPPTMQNGVGTQKFERSDAGVFGSPEPDNFGPRLAKPFTAGSRVVGRSPYGSVGQKGQFPPEAEFGRQVDFHPGHDLLVFQGRRGGTVPGRGERW
jgi:hypothetical protein